MGGGGKASKGESICYFRHGRILSGRQRLRVRERASSIGAEMLNELRVSMGYYKVVTKVANELRVCEYVDRNVSKSVGMPTDII